METIIATLITGACSIIAVVITNLSNNRKTEAQIEKKPSNHRYKARRINSRSANT